MSLDRDARPKRLPRVGPRAILVDEPIDHFRPVAYRSAHAEAAEGRRAPVMTGAYAEFPQYNDFCNLVGTRCVLHHVRVE
ncbi:hypothetical protein AB0896_13900 [Streptomyces parvulus]|uniref:hypothetical protein n=1 Tax=Streptomyces parvulus TaxID=146923 RepID=UPI0034531941